MEIDKIYNEDCKITLTRLEDDSVDMVMTSPPYNMTKRKGGNADTGRYDVYTDWLTEEVYIKKTVWLFNHLDRILKKDSIILYNFSYSIENPSLPYVLVSDIVQNTSFTLADTIVWKKPSGLPFPANERRLSRNWEFIWVFCRKEEINTFRCHKGVSKVSEKTGQKYYNLYYNMVEARNNDGKTTKLNQATYSSELCEKLFDIYADKGYVVYDPFMGTGTTAKACQNMDMHYIGSEISEAQCQYAEERLRKNTK